ncbi:MAG: PDZ domain-containing protein [Simkania sp.]|nr:PDZ domain-containing protein [Simkania sp.]
MVLRFRSLFYIILFPLALEARPPDLSLKDIRPMMEDMLAYHVEYKDLNPVLMRRAIKTFVSQFDPQKIYLTSAEVRPYLDMGDRKLQSAIANYYHDEFGDFVSFNRLMVNAIKRSLEWRAEIQRELALSGKDLPLEVGESYLHYAGSEQQLKERQRRQLIYFLREEKNQKPDRVWTPQMREKIGALWNARLSRHEKSYLSDRIHYIALHTLKSLAKSLDAHSSFYSQEEALEMRASLEKQFEGIGVILKEGIDGVEIADLIEGGPAHNSGLIAVGDLLVEINGKSQTSAAYDEVLSALQDGPNSSVLLGLKRIHPNGQEDVFHVQLKREKIVLNQERVQHTSIPYEDGIIGKITLPSFYESSDGSSCEKDLREALRQLKKQSSIKGIVLDLRENSGGFLNQAVKVSGLFMTNGVVVISKYANEQIQYLRNLDGRMYYKGPLVLLTSKLSASAAEIVAQALQDYGTAIIVGDERTYGKGTIQFQTLTDAEARAFFKVTVGRYYTVSGRSTQIEGVKADLVVPSTLAAFHIGERFLEYPLSNDKVPAAYQDPLADLDLQTKAWFQKNYLPNLQQKTPHWQKLIPDLKQRSSTRLQNNPEALAFLTKLHELQSSSTPGFPNRSWWQGEDWQMAEAIEIIKDMVELSSAKEPALAEG